MEKQNLIDQINFTCKLFVSIVLFAFIGFIFAYIFDLKTIIGYKLIILFAIIGSVRSVYLVLERF